MIFRFSYYSFESQLYPTIHTDSEADLIAAYLTDDGGSCLHSHIDFLNYCIKSLENNLLKDNDISSNSYGVDMINSQYISIYFLYDEHKKITLEKNLLLKIMKYWVRFISKYSVEGDEEVYVL